MVDETPVRLGGMALQNGVLVHGMTSWACAVRDAAGALHVASGRKPRFAPAARSACRSCVARSRSRKRSPSCRWCEEHFPKRASRSSGPPCSARSPRRQLLRVLSGARVSLRERGSSSPAGSRSSRLSSRSGARPRRVPRRGARLDRHLRERRYARTQGAPTVRLATHRAHGCLVARGERRRVEGARRDPRDGATVGPGGCCGWFRRALLLGRAEPGESVRTGARDPGSSSSDGSPPRSRRMLQLEVANVARDACLALER